jgi:hypothetical protein
MHLLRAERHALVLGAIVVAFWACGSGPTGPSTPLTGVWGGDHISLTVADARSHVELDCAHGSIPDPLIVNIRHEFNATGTFVREHGGPIRVDQLPDSHPAIYFGSVTVTTMVLTVQLTDTNEVIGSFTLVRDSPGRVVKCLLPLAA